MSDNPWNPAGFNPGLQQNLDAWDSLYQNAKVADAMVKANPDLPQRMGFQSPAQFQSLSAQDKIAATTGYIKNQGVQEFQAKMADYQAQAADRQAQAGLRQQDVQDQQTSGQFLQNYLTAPDTITNPDGTTRPATPQEKMAHAASSTPGMSGRILPKVMDSLSKWQVANASDAETKPVIPQEATVGGKKVIFNPRTGTFVEPDRVPDDMLATKPKPEDIPDGYMSRQYGKGWRIEQDPSRWQTIVETDPANPMRQIHTQQLVPKTGTTPPPKPGGATNPPPALKPGKVVIQNGNRYQVNADGTATFLGPVQ